MLLDDSLICMNLKHMVFGFSNTGNILEWDNRFLGEFVAKCDGKFSLITADGSFDCSVNDFFMLSL